MLKRRHGWPEALAAEIERAYHLPFSWGNNDCCLFACNCALVLTGIDLAASFRGYKTRREAMEVLKKFGGVSGVAEAVAHSHAVPEIVPLCARRGDVCLLDAGRGETLGVCVGDWIVCPGFSGLTAFPLLQGIRAWEIG